MNLIQKIKLLLTIKSEANKIQEAKMKDGIKTTEFWLTVLGSLVAVSLYFIGGLDVNTLALVIAVLTGIYTVSRAIVKKTASKKDDEVFNKVLNILKPLLEKLNIEVKEIVD
jgi:uncharacterized membrane protein